MNYSELDFLLEHYRCFDRQRTEQIKAGLHDYCLLTSVLPANDEERLHSRFIYSMINPDGLHYQGSEFLRILLDQLPVELRNFINLEQAVVEREKDKIDLLIHDGEHFIIIENKLDAGDQKYQITRYIKHVRERYFSECDDVSKNIAVVYLSKSRKRPSEKSQSLIGFELKEASIKWQGLADEELPEKVKGINLAKEQSIPFVHMGYFPTIEHWASECMKQAPDGISSAFKDYLAVLKRIDRQGSWRNVMTLDQYALKLSEDDQKDTYSFMVEANKSLVDFVSIKLHQELLRIFNNYEEKGESDLLVCEGHPRLITPVSIKNWLIKKPKRKEVWQDIACCTAGETQPKIGLLIGVNYASLSKLDDKGQVDYCENNRVVDGHVRKILLEQNGLYNFVACIEKKLKELGYEQG